MIQFLSCNIKETPLKRLCYGGSIMIEIFKFDHHKFEPIKNIEKDCWINVVKPDNIELERLSNKLNIPMDFMVDSLDIDERARIEKDGDAVLVILRIPIVNVNNYKIPFITMPVGIVFVDNIVLTICSLNINTILDLSSNRKNMIPKTAIELFLSCFSHATLLYLKYLKEINKKSIETEVALHGAMKNEELLQLLDIEKSLVFFTTSLRSNEFMMERVKKSGMIPMNEEEKELFDDIMIDNKQALETANIYSNILSGMMDAFASVISNNLNVVMKILTSITIILMIPTLVASVYGMNIKVPFQNSPHAFLIVMGISGLLSVAGVVVFINRKWF